jgi:hypothetical protein
MTAFAEPGGSSDSDFNRSELRPRRLSSKTKISDRRSPSPPLTQGHKATKPRHEKHAVATSSPSEPDNRQSRRFAFGEGGG